MTEPDAAAAAVAVPAEVWNRLRSFLPDRILHRVLTGSEFTEGERRDVTVLLADLSGYTTLSEKMDPEDVIAMVNECFAFCVEIIYEHGGIIDKFMGDAVMAIFGAPVAHQDDPARAVRSALAIRQRMAVLNASRAERKLPPLEFTFGIATGLVVAGTVGSTRRQEYTVIGDTVNLAARLETKAEHGQIIVSEETWRRSQTEIAFEDLGETKVKGKEKPVRIFAATAVAERAASMRAASMIGREAPLSNLFGAFAAASDGAPNVVLIRGEAGSGRGLLGETFLRRLVEAEPGVVPYQFRTRLFDLAIPLFPIRLLLAQALGLLEVEGAAERGARLEDYLAAHRLEGDPACRVFLRSLFLRETGGDCEDAEISAAARNRAVGLLADALRDFSLARPLAVLLEDAEGLDTLSAAVLARALFPEEEAGPRARILVMGTVTPDDAGALGGLAEAARGRDALFEIRLPGFTEEEAARFALAALGAPLSPDLVARLRDRAAGNPLFIREVLATLTAGGALRRGPGGIEIADEKAFAALPSTIVQALQSRLDRIDESALRVLKHASVQGARIERTVLGVTTRLDDASLETFLVSLTGESFLRALDRTFARVEFAHMTLRDVAYNGLLKKHRVDLHRRVAEALVQDYAGREEEIAEALGHHFSLAEAAIPAGRYLDAAARKAARLYAFDVAASWRRRAVALLAAVADPTRRAEADRWRLVHLVALATQHLALDELEEARIAIEEALVVPAPPRDLERRARLLAGRLAYKRADFPGAEREWRAALGLSDGPAEEAETRDALGVLFRQTGRAAEAMQELEAAARLSSAADAGRAGTSGGGQSSEAARRRLLDAILAEANAAQKEGTAEKAADAFLRAAQIQEKAGDSCEALALRRRASQALFSGAMRAFGEKANDRARALFTRQIEIDRTTGNESGILYAARCLEKIPAVEENT